MRFVYALLLMLFIGCSFKKTIDESLPVLDLSKNYPVRTVVLSDIADIDYVALETTNSSLLTGYTSSFFVSDKHIVTYDIPSGDIFVFRRNGKFLHKINHKGNGGEEYIQLNLVVAFDTEEFFVYDRPRDRFLVYSFNGSFIRSFSIDGKRVELYPLYDYDRDYLIGYNNFYTYETKRCEDEHPFYLISKKDGTKTPLNLNIQKRISDVLATELIDLGGGQCYVDQPSLPIFPLLKNGSDYLIAEYALDTLYSFTDGRLIPIAKQTPSVFSTEPPVIVAPNLFTDSYLQFRIIPIYYDVSNSFKPFDEAPVLIWNRHTDQIEKWEIYKTDYGTDKVYNELPDTWIEYPYDRNTGISFYSAEHIIERYKEGKLSGKLLEIAPNLKEDDNIILEIVKYR